MSHGALHDVRVLDLSRALAGPYCTAMLGDMGADIVKVEMPGVGDEARYFGPPFINGESAYFMSVNRNKRSMTLNMKRDRGKRIVKDMARIADVVIENFRPGTMERLGLGYDVLRELNPKLVFCSITGFGSTGPDANRPGYDLIAQGMGGIMSCTGEKDGSPLKVGVSLADITAGMFAAYGVLAALFQRRISGKGQRVETSLFESQLAQLTFQAGRYFATGESPTPMGNRHPVIAPYESFRTSDGHINIAVANNALWAVFCKAIGIEKCEKDPRFETNPLRVLNRPELIEVIEAVTSTMSMESLRKILDEAGIPNGPVWTVEDAVESPQAAARKMVQEIEHPTTGTIRTTGIPVKLDSTPGEIRRPPPTLGEHTEEVLNEWLGMSREEIRQLRDDGVV